MRSSNRQASQIHRTTNHLATSPNKTTPTVTQMPPLASPFPSSASFRMCRSLQKKGLWLVSSAICYPTGRPTLQRRMLKENAGSTAVGEPPCKWFGGSRFSWSFLSFSFAIPSHFCSAADLCSKSGHSFSYSPLTGSVLSIPVLETSCLSCDSVG
jgi:hypothetical protein